MSDSPPPHPAIRLPVNTSPISVSHGGITFQVEPTHTEFWQSVNDGSWEQETFRLFDHCIKPDTVVLDIGTWIGPTLLYAAAKARLTLGCEPDPAAFRTLAANVALNPTLNPVKIFPAAIAAERGQARMGSRSAAGDSMSSLLFAESAESWTVELHRIEDFEPEWPAGAPLLLKIDIEGGEYGVIPHLRNFIVRHRPAMCLSLHPQFLLLPYRGGGFFRRLGGELALLAGTWRAYRRVFSLYPYLYDPAGGRLHFLDLFRGQRWRRWGGLVLAHERIDFLERPAATP